MAAAKSSYLQLLFDNESKDDAYSFLANNLSAYGIPVEVSVMFSCVRKCNLNLRSTSALV